MNTIERSVAKIYAFVYVPDKDCGELPEARVYSDIRFARLHDEFVGEFDTTENALKAAEKEADEVRIELGLDVMRLPDNRLLDFALATMGGRR